MWIIIVSILIIIFGLVLIFYLLSKQHRKNKSDFSVQSVLPKAPKQEPTEEIEVLDVFADEKELVDDDSLNLDDLFKTISMTAINDDDFDFGLRRSKK